MAWYGIAQMYKIQIPIENLMVRVRTDLELDIYLICYCAYWNSAGLDCDQYDIASFPKIKKQEQNQNN